MGPLPRERVTQAEPLAYTGVDYTGPILIKAPNGQDEKRYRVIARQGVPEKIISDNGTNFLLSELILSNNVNNDDSDHLSFFLAEHRITWYFIPPASPWMGGIWERMVGLVKRAMQKTIGRRKLTDKLLQTPLCEIESIVNSRPLTHTGEDDPSFQVLRPSGLHL
ncbi:unnamed protein product [Cylicocyclus nassatus]|uniref:Integrase catalytic domain-containing protein n=1 Tax=Cylicocyclus nassatus TaxID=53992 RepID=A0AA36MDF6_CYLNA|nr:unnamed protein product [Cylicocyclus nassatus]